LAVRETPAALGDRWGIFARCVLSLASDKGKASRKSLASRIYGLLIHLFAAKSSTRKKNKKPAPVKERVESEWLNDERRNRLLRYFCHVRFLCRLDFRRLRRLCFDIFRRRFFLRLPMVMKGMLRKGERADLRRGCKARF
jgi:hypothetical protein